ncbi:metalloendopeptidase, partial [Nephila pilipes]
MRLTSIELSTVLRAYKHASYAWTEASQNTCTVTAFEGPIHHGMCISFRHCNSFFHLCHCCATAGGVYVVLFQRNRVASLSSSDSISCRNSLFPSQVTAIFERRNLNNVTMLLGVDLVHFQERRLKMDDLENGKMSRSSWILSSAKVSSFILSSKRSTLYSKSVFSLVGSFSFVMVARIVDHLRLSKSSFSLTTNIIIRDRNAVVDKRMVWPGGIVYYVLDPGISKTVSHAVLSVAMWVYERDTCIRFIPRKTEKDYIRIFPGQG